MLGGPCSIVLVARVDRERAIEMLREVLRSCNGCVTDAGWSIGLTKSRAHDLVRRFGLLKYAAELRAAKREAKLKKTRDPHWLSTTHKRLKK